MRRSIAILALLLLPTLVLAQAETTGRVAGRVVDEAGAPVAGAKVSITSPALQGERTFTTDANGRFLAPLLPPGQYVVVITAPGRQTVGFTARVGVGQTVPLDAMLAKGSLVEEVKVTGDISKLETTTGGENFNYETKVDSLPITDRDPERVAELAPNIAFGPSTNTLSISGAPSFDTVVLLDGAEVSDPYYGSAPELFLEDALEEVQVLTSGVPARYGRFQGGVINATTKSGGNTLDASLRVDLNKETWNQSTPAGEPQSDQLNKTYQATVGGPIVKDRLWYFIGGRTIPTENDAQLTELSGQPFVESTNQDRYQIKLTGAVTPNHVFEVSHLSFDQSTSNYAGLPAADTLALGQRDDPRKTYTAEYQGILSDRLFVNVQGTVKRVSINSGGDPARGDPFLDLYDASGAFQVWHNAWWDHADTDVRDNDTMSASVTQLLSTGKWGDHTLEYGVQYVVNTTGGENRQSSTGYNLLNYDAAVSGNAFSNVGEAGFDPADPRFNLISLDDEAVGVTYRWEALPLGGNQKLKNTALYVQDTWQKGPWRADVGVRYEQYQGTGPEKTLDLDFREFAPRLGITYSMNNDWQLQATWGKYVSRFNDNVASNISGVGGAPYIVSLYTGPTTCALDPETGFYTHCLTYNEVQAINRDDANWGVITTITDPLQPTRFLASDARAPYADELNVAVKRALPKSSGNFTLTYTTRKYKSLLDDYVGGYGTSTVVDPKGSGAEFEFDTTLWKNSGEARREYEALTAAWDYRPGARWGLGGNWTHSWTRGNYEGEGRNTPSSGSIIGDYPNSIPYADAVPYGYLSADIRDRVRAWGNYRFDLKRAGALTLSAIGTYQSGSPWSRVAAVPLGDDPTYLNDAGLTYTHFFDGRGNNRFSGWWRLDFGTRYQIALWKDLNFWAKLDVVNVTNNDQLIRFRTSGVAVVNDAGVLVWEPAEGFGEARNETDYQTPRSYFVAVGLTW